jgi:hypothetical protein
MYKIDLIRRTGDSEIVEARKRQEEKYSIIEDLNTYPSHEEMSKIAAALLTRDIELIPQGYSGWEEEYHRIIKDHSVTEIMAIAGALVAASIDHYRNKTGNHLMTIGLGDKVLRSSVTVSHEKEIVQYTVTFKDDGTKSKPDMIEVMRALSQQNGYFYPQYKEIFRMEAEGNTLLMTFGRHAEDY